MLSSKISSYGTDLLSFLMGMIYMFTLFEDT